MSNLIEIIVASIQSNIAFALIALSVLIVIYTLSLAIIFKKIGHKTVIAFVPIYNIMSLLTILNIPQWMVLIMFIPFVNILGFIFMSVLVGYKLGTLCRKNIIMKFGLMLFPPIFYPLLAFSEIDIDGSKVNIVVPVETKKEFKLDPVEFETIVDVPVALNLADASNVEKITQKKIKTTVEEVEPANMTQMTIVEHLSKANKERPTAQDLTFDYNLIYNSKETKEEKVEEIVEEIIEPKQEVIVEDTNDMIVEEDNTPIVPIVYDVVLDEAVPIDTDKTGPIPINQRYENQQAANRRQKEMQREKEKQQEEEIKIEIEPATILDNGPISIDSSLSRLMASAPDFNVPVKDRVANEQKKELVEEKKDNVPTTMVQEIVSMNIVEPSQLPVGKIQIEEEKVDVENPKETIDNTKGNNMGQNSSQLLRPIVSQSQDSILVDKACPQCSAKMKRDCPVCIICGYRF